MPAAGRFLPRHRFCNLTVPDNNPRGYRYRPRARKKGEVEDRRSRTSPTTASVCRRWCILAEGAAGSTVAKFVGPTGAGRNGAVAAPSYVGCPVWRHPHRQRRSSRHQASRRCAAISACSRTARCSIARSPTIHIGKPDATQAELEEAARLAEAHDHPAPIAVTRPGRRARNHAIGRRTPAVGDVRRCSGDPPPILIPDEATSA